MGKTPLEDAFVKKGWIAVEGIQSHGGAERAAHDMRLVQAQMSQEGHQMVSKVAMADPWQAVEALTAGGGKIPGNAGEAVGQVMGQR